MVGTIKFGNVNLPNVVTELPMLLFGESIRGIWLFPLGYQCCIDFWSRARESITRYVCSSDGLLVGQSVVSSVHDTSLLCR